MKYAYKPRYVDIYRDNDGRLRVANLLTEKEYLISGKAAVFLHFLNGKRDPLIVGGKLGYSPEDIRTLFKNMSDRKLVRRSRFHYNGGGLLFGLMFTLWTPSWSEPPRTLQRFCRVVSLIILFSFIPACIAAVIMCVIHPVTTNDYDMWSLLAGYLTGAILHECAGHLCSAIWLGADIYETGLVPIGAYVMTNETGRTPMASAQISAAGIETNLLTGSVFIILASLMNSRNMLLIGSINIGLSLVNAAPKAGFDGNSAAEQLIKIDLAVYANAVLRDRNIQKKIAGEKDCVKFYASAIGIRVIQLTLTAAGLLVSIMPELL